MSKWQQRITVPANPLSPSITNLFIHRRSGFRKVGQLIRRTGTYFVPRLRAIIIIIIMCCADHSHILYCFANERILLLLLYYYYTKVVVLSYYYYTPTRIVVRDNCQAVRMFRTRPSNEIIYTIKLIS